MKPAKTHILITTLLIALVAGLVTPLQAQDSADTVSSLPGIEVETAVDKAEAYIGDLITYTLIIKHDSTYHLVPPPLGANLGAFDVKDYEPDVTSKLEGGRIQSRTTFVLCTFTTGDYTIPPLPVVFTLADGSRKVLLAEPVPIRILSVLGDTLADTLDIRGLKGQYAFPRDYTLYYVVGGGLVMLLGLAAGLWIWLRRRRMAGEPVDLRQPWEKAFEKLAYLRQSGLVSQGKCQEFYFELTEIARTYLGQMYKHDVLEMTTEQFLETFAEIELPTGLYDQLAGYFKHADLAKFARYVPAVERTETDFEFTHRMIESVRADLERRAQAETSLSGGGTVSTTAVEEQAS
jgi:hypothetical protein